MLVSPIEISQTSASGAWSFNTDRISGGHISHIFIKSATATTTFDITMTDDKGYQFYSTSRKGNTAEGVLDDEVSLPVLGKITIACASASADEAFTGRVWINN